MTNQKFETKLKEYLFASCSEPSNSTKSTIKTKIMSAIIEKQEVLSYKSLLLALKRAFVPAKESQLIRVKNIILATMKEPQEALGTWWNSFTLKTATSTTLAIIVIIVSPSLYSTQTVTATEGLYIKATEGKVFVDGTTIPVGELISITPGTSISTGRSGQARIIAPHKAFITLGTKTVAKIADSNTTNLLSIKTFSGKFWGFSLTIPVVLEDSDNAFIARTENGSANLEINKSYVRISSTSISNILINTSQDISLNHQLFPGELLTMSKRTRSTRKGEIKEVTKEEYDWIATNLQESHTFNGEARSGKLASVTKNAGALPGNLLYPLEQFTNNALLSFSWNNTQKADQLLYYAGKDFAKSIALFEQGNETAAVQHLNAYASKVYSTLELVSATIGEEKNRLANKLTYFIQSKADTLGTIGNQEPLTLAKKRTKELILNVVPQVNNTDETLRLLTDMASKFLTEAHDLATQQLTDLALEKLEDYIAVTAITETESGKTQNLELISKLIQQKTENLAILNALTQLQPLQSAALNLQTAEAKNIEHLSTLLMMSTPSDASKSIRGQAM